MQATAICAAAQGNTSETDYWNQLKHPAQVLPAALQEPRDQDLVYYESPQSPAVLVRMKSTWIRFFGDLGKFSAEPPSRFWIKTPSGTRMLRAGQSVSGSEMAASWILASFQESRGWDRFDVPWFICLERRPTLVSLSSEGLRIQFSAKDTGYVFSMPLYGYDKLPQRNNDFAASNHLPSLNLRPWEWNPRLPQPVADRCDWWARVGKAYPIGFQESYSVAPAKDEIKFRQDFRWLIINDDWATPPLRFAPLPPGVGLAWKFPGFPMTFSAPIDDPEYFTAFGPFVGAHDVDRLEISMQVLRYIHEMEWPSAPEIPAANQRQASDLIAAGVSSKFPNSWQFIYDHGSRSNFCWNIVGDVWYSRGLPLVPASLASRAKKALSIYMSNDVLRPQSPYHGKFILHGPGVGSWGEWGDAGKFMTSALEAIWAYGQFADGWPLVRERWPLIKRFFVTPEQADWASFGRYSIAEIGDEAAPCLAYARMAWAVGDLDEYLRGASMFARELVHLYIKQRAGRYFYEHQPYNQYSAMPPQIYPTDVWGSTRGWQVDGPLWGHLDSGEHQSANRWVRFHDPDVGRFYRDFLASDVKSELDWYENAGRKKMPGVYRISSYQDWLRLDNPHILPSLLRLHSLLLNTPLTTEELVQAARAPSGWGAADIALGYSIFRKLTPLKYVRVVPARVPASPFVIGLGQNPDEFQTLNTVQDVRQDGLSIESRWQGWGPSGQYLSFGFISGDFAGKVSGAEGQKWIASGCKLSWAEGISPRKLESAGAILRGQDHAPVAVIGPFSNADDLEITDVSYPPEKTIDLRANYPGAAGSVSWQSATLADGRQLDLSRVMSRSSGTLAYALQYVWSPSETDAYLLASHQGGMLAWINENEVIRIHGMHQRSSEDSAQGLGHLRQGWNKILLKFESFTGSYLFRFRLVHLDRQPIPGLKFAVDTP